MKSKWHIVHDCNGENGEPSCWSREINHPRYGRYVWISRNAGDKFDVEVMPHDDVKLLASCRSLASAKRWVSVHLG